MLRLWKIRFSLEINGYLENINFILSKALITWLMYSAIYYFFLIIYIDVVFVGYVCEMVRRAVR